jgi:hypothetical protein
MIREDHEFIVDVVVIDLMWEMVAFSVISQPIGVVVEFNAIAKIHKYKGFMKGTILFQWPWRCTTHPHMIWIVSLGSVLIFCIINN